MARWDEHPVKGVNGFGTEHAAAIMILLALGFLLLVRRGFRGVAVPGVGAIGIG